MSRITSPDSLTPAEVKHILTKGGRLIAFTTAPHDQPEIHFLDDGESFKIPLHSINARQRIKPCAEEVILSDSSVSLQLLKSYIADINETHSELLDCFLLDLNDSPTVLHSCDFKTLLAYREHEIVDFITIAGRQGPSLDGKKMLVINDNAPLLTKPALQALIDAAVTQPSNTQAPD